MELHNTKESWRLFYRLAMLGLLALLASCRDPGVRPPRCGNGVVEGREQCDDGNEDPGDGCSPECLLEGGEICGNYDDDDGDRLADCADPDCLGHPTCEVDPPLENCHNSYDDDGDGKTDCDDEDCVETSYCVPDEDCENGVDDNRNGQTDCADPACSLLPVCGACDATEDLGVLPVDAVVERQIDQEPEGDLSSMSCPEGDTADTELRFTLEAPAHLEAALDISAGSLGGLSLLKEEDPGNSCEIDEWDCRVTDATGVAQVVLDGLPPGTYRLAAKPGTGGFGGPHTLSLVLRDGSVEHRCEDGIDEDRDGLTDCDDDDCATWPACATEVCDNGIDDDGDGLTDCDDLTCDLAAPCLPPEDCENGVDDDGDGLTDCADTECAGGASCTGGTCVVNYELGSLSRGDEVLWSFDTSSATNNNDLPCGGATGPDLVGAFTLEHHATVRVDLQGSGHHLLALTTEAGGDSWCDEAVLDCQDPGGVGLPVSFSHSLPAARYFVLVEAATEVATGMGEVSLQVFDPLTELCDDGLDNDGDGETDCDDDDCVASPLCVPEALCHDSLDDDGDGHTDCEDLDCLGAPACANPACVPDRDLGTVGPLSPAFLLDATYPDTDRVFAECATGGGGGDRIYAFELATEAGVVIRLNQSSGSDHVVSLSLPGGPGAPCDAAQHLCEEAGGTGLPIVSEIPSLPPGRYFILVDAYGPWGTGDFSLQVSLW